MGTISTAIELHDNFTDILMNVINAVNISVSTMESMQSAISRPIDTASIEGIRSQLDQAVIAAQELETAMQEIESPAPAASNLWQSYEGPEVFTGAGLERFEQETANVNAMLERLGNAQDRITRQANESIILSPQASYEVQMVENRIQGLTEMIQQAEKNPLNLGTDTANAGLEKLRGKMNEISQVQESLSQAMEGMDVREINEAYLEISQMVSDTERFVRDSFSNIPSVEIPVVWQSNSLDVFTNSGIERFEMEVQSANNMLNTLNQTQAQIAATAAQTSLFPPNMVTDINGMQTRLQEIQSRIQTIESNPLNMGTDTANTELEQLRAQLNQAVQEQELMNHAVETMDVQAANEAYLRLSQIIGRTEMYIRDNVDEQGRFRREIEESAGSAVGLKNMIASAVGAFAGIAGLRKAKNWIDDCTAAFNTQLNAETQLVSVLTNMLDEDYAAPFEVETVADTTAVVHEINAIQNEIDEMVIPVTAETKALTAAYDQITAKASEIQGRGIYGDEAMIAAAAEFSTYFTDTDAIGMMMDTLSNYAMGMTGGGEIDAAGMVDYATNLGKIMSGSYDAMTKKGFEFSDAQKAIIEGEATREQIVSALGEQYVDMSSDMQAAAAITQVIDESWAGLYESMSNTPEGKIIQLTNTWGDMKEMIGGQVYPYVILFVNAITENQGTIQTVLDNITIGLEYMLGFLSCLTEGAINFAQVVIDNWGWISPIIYGIIGALAVYGTYLAITKGLELASAAAKGAMIIAENIHAAAIALTTGATMAEVAAQEGLNTTMYACPITWLIIMIIALASAFYAAVAAVNHFAGTSISATGLICGAFAAMGAFIINSSIVPTWNIIVMFVNFLGNAFHDPIAAIKVAFYDMCLTVIGYIQNLANAIQTLLNKIPGVTVDITSGLDNFYSGLEQAQQAVKDESGWVEYLEKMDFIDYKDAANAGYNFGKGIDESIANFDPSSLFGITDIPSPKDYANLSTYGTDIGLSDIGGNVNDIAGNTGAIADSMDITQDDMKYLRDIAEQETINRFTTAEINIDMSGMQNTLQGNDDLDGFISGLTDAVHEAADNMAEGVHE